MRQRLKCAQTHFVNKARCGGVPIPQQQDEAHGEGRLSWNAGHPVPESTAPTTRRQGCPRKDPGRRHNPAKACSLSAAASGALLLLCPLPRGLVPVCSRGISSEPSPDPRTQTVTSAPLLLLCGFVFSPWNLILSFHHTTTWLFYFSSPAMSAP